MNYKKIIAFFLVLIFLLSSTLPCATAQSDDSNLIEKVLLGWFNLRRGMFGSPYFVLRFVEPEVFKAEPNIISLAFLDQTDITVGAIVPDTGEYQSLMYDDYVPNSLMVGHDFEFKLELPDYVPDDAFVAHFSPQTVYGGEEGDLKSKLIITSNIPKDATLPRNIQLRINITKYTTFGNLFLPEKGHRGKILPLLQGNIGMSRITWFLASIGIPGGHRFGFLYSGKRLLEYSTYVDIVVKLDRFHLADVMPCQRTEVGPDELISIPVDIQNLGSHVDTFNFKVSSNTKGELIISPPSAITLNPNEIGHTSISVASPLKFLDPGTAHTINIEAYSIYDNTSWFSNSATVVTRGIYISEINTVFSFLFAIIVILGFALLYFRRKKVQGIKYKKPEKPWKIPEERAFLKELLETDKKKYLEVIEMMKEEYESSLMWFDSYKDAMRQKEIEEMQRQPRKPGKNIFDNLVKKFKKSEKQKEPKKEKKPEVKPKKKPKEEQKEKLPVFTEVEEKPKEQPKPVDTEQESDKRKRDKKLQKIKNQQEKQRRKLRK